ncbi:MAG: hypothetical protein IJL21_00620 [Alphaproteobacteria bacterium]|nr:hypothetical protein [Alphaproteobacteria bacterium]MBQ7127803.1 hypothetical protein [Alphaproteobacteria bacterium]
MHDLPNALQTEISKTEEDIKNELLELDNFRLNILTSIKKIPPKINVFDIIDALKKMTISEEKINGMIALKLNFNRGTTPEIMDIITNAAYRRKGVTQRNLLNFNIVDFKGNIINSGGECPFETLSNVHENFLSEYPGCYIKINGDLDLRNTVNKKDKTDYSYLRDIIVSGDFYPSKYNKIFPHRVDGTFDCSGLGKDYITKDTVLPITHKINCAYSITDFDVLMNIMPKRYDNNYDEFDTTHVKTLIVEPKLIKKEFLSQNKEHFTNVLNFIEHYPYVTVLDTKGNNLLDMLVEKCRDKKVTQEPTVIEITTTPSEKTFEEKIQGQHLEVKEILTILRTLPQYNIYTDGELDRFIRLVLSDQRKNGIQKKTMRRADGVNVICINKSQIELVKQDLQNVINERIKEEKTITEYIPTKTNEFLKTEPVKRKPIKIKKYITTDLLKKIEKSSKQNVNTVLQAINEINLDPLEMQLQGAVHIIKDNKETVSATVTRESGCCLVQSIDSSNHTDSKRIVWGIADGPDGLIIISIGYIEHHNTKKASNKYRDLRDNAYKKQTYTQQELDAKGYIDIETLINKDFSNTGNSDSDITIPQQPSDILTQQMLNMSHPSY